MANFLIVSYFVGLVITFIFIFFLSWVYSIAKHGFLLGGSLGTVPSIIAGIVFMWTWPLWVVLSIYVWLFRPEWLPLIKAKIILIIKTVSAFNY